MRKIGVESSIKVCDRIKMKAALANHESLRLIHIIGKKADEQLNVKNKKVKQ